MTTFVTRSLAALVFVGALFAGVAAPAAHASTLAHDPSFVGTYSVHGAVDGGGRLHGTLTVKADGTATDQHGQVANWSNSGKNFTLSFVSGSESETFVGHQSKKGIGTKKQPGTFTSTIGLSGTWYAVKTG